MKTDKNEYLIELLKNGNEEGFKELYHKVATKVFNFIMVLVKDKLVAEDILQETFIKVYKYIEKYKKEKGSFENWIYKIAKNTSFAYLTKKKKYSLLQMEYNYLEEEKIKNETYYKKQEVKFNSVINNALMKLVFIERVCFVLKIYNDKSIEEISEIIGKSKATVKRNLKKASKKFIDFTGENFRER